MANGFKIWLSPAILTPQPETEIEAFRNTDDATVNYGDDGSGDVVSMQPDGTFTHRPNGTKGEWEVCAQDAQVNTLNYATYQNIVPGGIHYKAPFRAR